MTKGLGGLYPLHRGIISFGDQQADLWHCNNGESQINIANESYPHYFAGTEMAENRNFNDWNGRDCMTFSNEHRTLRAYHGNPSHNLAQVIDFVTVLSAIIEDPIHWKGDP